MQKNKSMDYCPTDNWRSIARIFHQHAKEYDSWFENNPLFLYELAALRKISVKLPIPKLEIGSGPGRFAAALNIDFGLDPAFHPLQLASNRGIAGICARGEQLPIRSHSVGSVFILFTLCFVDCPDLIFNECQRILKKSGLLIIGMIPQESIWGRNLQKKGRQGDPYYRLAHFHTVTDTIHLAKDSGFILLESWSTLYQPPGKLYNIAEPLRGADEEAGFCILVFRNEEFCRCNQRI